jgi:LPXTG cell wall anchor motif
LGEPLTKKKAQDQVQQARDYMQSPEGEQALQQAQEDLQQAWNNVQQAGQQLQKAREGAQEKMQERTAVIERTTKEGLPQSGGAPVGSVLLPAAGLLVGSGLLAYAVLRRR